MLAIPARYPTMIAIVNTTDFPFVDLDVMLLYTEIGQETPKQISIILSKTVTMIFLLCGGNARPFFVRYHYTLDKR